MVQTLPTIRALLAERGLRPRRGLGQNFLHDPNKLKAIMDAVAVREGDLVLEVGPGTGVLTERLLEAGARVVAVELDPAMADILRQQVGPDGERFRLLQQDVLAGKHAIDPGVATALRRLGGEGSEGDAPAFELVANLPYSVASPLLLNLGMDWPAMHRATVMVQREVADRMLAGPGSKTYGTLGIILQALFEVRTVTRLSPGCFWPEPKVSSAVVQLTRRAEPRTDDAHRLSDLLHRLFSKRRKQIGAILGRDTPLPPSIDASARPEQLSVEQLIELATTIEPKPRS